jgi:hypothetical protein
MKRSYFLFFFILLIPPSHALGITYNRYVNFEPGLEESYDLCIKNSHSVFFPVQLTVTGDLEEYITLKDSTLTLSPNELRCTKYTLKLPESLGVHGQVGSRIIASQIIDPYEQDMFQVQENIIHKFFVFVPYPGYHVEFFIEGENVNAGEPIQFLIRATNYGSDDIESAKAIIDIYGADNASSYVTTLETREKKLPSMKPVSMYTLLDTTGLKPGTYSAKARIEYDSKVALAQADFNIGALQIIVSGYTRELYAGQINKFDINVSSMWNNALPALYARVRIDGIEEQIVTPTMPLKPWESITLTGYLNVPEMESGDHAGTIDLIYSNVSSKPIRVGIIGKQKESPTAQVAIPEKTQASMISVNNLLIVLIVLFVILDIFLLARKKRDTE